MPNAQSHSPLPWRNDDTTIRDPRGGNVAFDLLDEDAEFIIRAVNAHYALVAALETLDRIERGLQGWHEDATEAWAKARAALALAKGQA